MVADMIRQIRALSAGSSRHDLATRKLAKLEEGVGRILRVIAVSNGEKLRKVADALAAREQLDARQMNIIKAYTKCIDQAYPPTLTELREVFVRMHGKKCWTSEYSVRKTLRVLKLRLRNDRRGRPPGAKSIRN